MSSPSDTLWTRHALFGLVAAIAVPARSEGFDYAHEAWTRLSSKHVVLRADGNASKSVLTQYPRLASIKDLGSLWQSPWKKRFFSLFGNETSLNDIENGVLRRPGRFDDPRIHFAINCASIGCTALRPEAYVARQLDTQLDALGAKFLADRSRNRWNPERQRLDVSILFDWFGDDFRRGFRGIASPQAIFARHADATADCERIRTMRAELDFLPCDWSLNDVRT